MSGVFRYAFVVARSADHFVDSPLSALPSTRRLWRIWCDKGCSEARPSPQDIVVKVANLPRSTLPVFRHLRAMIPFDMMI